jgi:hypothetical protein
LNQPFCKIWTDIGKNNVLKEIFFWSLFLNPASLPIPKSHQPPKPSHTTKNLKNSNKLFLSFFQDKFAVSNKKNLMKL